MANVNLKLKGALVAKFGTQEDAAAAIGMRADKLSRIINSRHKPSREQRDLIARAIGCKAEEIFQEG